MELFYDPMGLFVAHPADDVPDGRAFALLAGSGLGLTVLIRSIDAYAQSRFRRI